MHGAIWEIYLEIFFIVIALFDRKKFFKECTLSNVFPENFYKKPSIEKGFDVPLHKYLCENEPEDFFHVPKNIVKTFDKNF